MDMIKIPNYKILERIHAGVKNILYRGIKKDNTNPVILKVLNVEYPTMEEREAFKREFEIQKKLAGIPGIIKAIEIQKYGNGYVTLFEDIGGISLAQYYKSDRLTLECFFDIAIKITEILGEVHRYNILHKDIKPQNIIFNPETNVLKLTDFGSASLLSRENPVIITQALKGTLAYISPEQTGRMNRHIDYRTDYYSLGAVFYELLTGEVPFKAQDAMELVHSHIARQPESPSRINPKIPPGLSNLVLKLLEKSAEARYQSARGIKADLEKCKDLLETTGTIKEFTLAENDYSEQFQIPQKLYGREHEIRTLISTYERVAVGQAETLLIAGYSGIGKSALVKEIYRSLTPKKGYFISGKFDQLHRNVPYSALVNAFKDLVQQLLTESEERLLAWKEKLLAALGPNGRLIVDVIPEIKLIIKEQEPVPDLGPTEAQNRFILVFQNFMRVFCGSDHPLVIFLDDLQWVDSATLRLLEPIMTDRENRAFFLIGAYRDNEVSPTHPLMTTFDNLDEKGVTVNRITLNPLSEIHINQLIRESLHCDIETAGSLTELVARKTGGNPFFVNQFLHTLFKEDMLHFVPPTPARTSHWKWDIERIKALNITDNVVDLMIGKLKKLPASAQQAFRLAACVGNRFDLNTLSVIYEMSILDTFQDLTPVLEEGLLLPLSEATPVGSESLKSAFVIHKFQFLHDRVQQAAYALIDEEQKQIVHLQIGRLLLKSAPADSLDEKVFDVVRHFNHSIELINSPTERLEIARLNLKAGQKAKLASAYSAAVNYSGFGLKCLETNSWESSYELTLNLFTEATEAAYLHGDYQQMEEFARDVAKKARTLPDEVKIIETLILAFMAQNKQPEAIQTALTFLERVGIHIPQEPTDEDVGVALSQIQSALSNKPIQDLLESPVMANAGIKPAIGIMMTVSPAAYRTSPRLMLLLVLTQVDLCLQHGNIPESSFVYAAYAMVLCAVLGDVDTGYQFGRLALDLLERFGEKRVRARTIELFNTSIRIRKKHIKETFRPLLDAYQIGLETGDLEYAAYSVFNYLYHCFFTGKRLSPLEQEILSYDRALSPLKQTHVLNWNKMLSQVVLNLTKENNNPCRMVGEVYDEKIQLPLLRQANDRLAIHLLHLHKCILHYLFSEYKLAHKNALIAEEYLDGATGMVMIPVFYFYDSLILLATYHGQPDPEQESVLVKVNDNQNKLQQWVTHAPMNYEHKYVLVEAEKARVVGENWKAAELYEKAIAGAKENEYINEEALGYELAGKFYLAQGQTRIARLSLYDAHYAYRQWGAKARVADLERRYPRLLSIKPAGVLTSEDTTSLILTSSSATSHSELLDLTSIMKASQTLSGEVVLSRFLEKMMKIMFENAGAQKAILILQNGERAHIEAIITENDIHVLNSTPIEEYRDIPLSIIRYVLRTGAETVLQDAGKEVISDARFAEDPYIKEKSPRSILCVPIRHKDQIQGVLYLENNISTGAFSSERTRVLNILLAQAAVSLENARIYDRLEELVKARTSELEQTHKQLLDTAHRAGMAEVATNVLHNVGNALNSAIVPAEKLREGLDNFRLEPLKKITQLLEDNRENLAEFLTAGGQGARIPDYISKLNKYMHEERGNMSVSLSRLQNSLTHIKEVIRLQQSYTGGLKLEEEIDLAGLLEDALQIEGEALKSEKITVNRKYTALSPLKSDRHKLMLILINLLSNARNALISGDNADKEIELILEKNEAENFIIQVRDNGAGIDRKNIVNIFSHGFTTKIKGHGFGLHSAANAAAELGGKLNAHSNGPGQGATFTLELPSR